MKNKITYTFVTMLLLPMLCALSFAQDNETVPFESAKILGCFECKSDLCLRSCVSSECTTERNKSFDMLTSIFNRDALTEIEQSECSFCPGACSGDDAIVFDFKLKNMKIRIIDSRVISIIVKTENFSTDDLSVLSTEIETILLDLFKQPDSGRFRIHMASGTQTTGEATGFISKGFHSVIAWQIRSSSISLILNNVEMRKSEGMHDFRNPDPVIRFPELRNTQKIKYEIRQDIKDRNEEIARIEKSQELPPITPYQGTPMTIQEYLDQERLNMTPKLTPHRDER